MSTPADLSISSWLDPRSSWPERGPRQLTVVTSQRAGTIRVRVALRLKGALLARPLQG